MYHLISTDSGVIVLCYTFIDADSFFMSVWQVFLLGWCASTMLGISGVQRQVKYNLFHSGLGQP